MSTTDYVTKKKKRKIIANCSSLSVQNEPIETPQTTLLASHSFLPSKMEELTGMKECRDERLKNGCRAVFAAAKFLCTE